MKVRIRVIGARGVRVAEGWMREIRDSQGERGRENRQSEKD